MDADLVFRLMNWISDLNLPEPEIQYVADIESQAFEFAIAYPEYQVAIKLADETKYAEGIGDWRVWTCTNEDEVREALIGIGYWIDTENVPLDCIGNKRI